MYDTQNYIYTWLHYNAYYKQGSARHEPVKNIYVTWDINLRLKIYCIVKFWARKRAEMWKKESK